jgi:outer membrane immunogenic protein
MLRRFIFLAVMLLSFMVRHAAAAPPAYEWSGFYFGGKLGAGWGSLSSDYNVTSTFLFTDPSASGSQGISGPIGGIEAGYMWQTSNWVLGVATDFELSGYSSSALVAVPVPFTPPVLFAPTARVLAFSSVDIDHSVQLPWFGTVRGLIGLSATPGWLVYATGGLAYAQINETNTITAPIVLIGSHSLLQTGWTVGGGIAVALSSNVSAKLEYLHIDLGSFTDTASDGFASATVSSRLNLDAVMIGLDYKFGVGP